MTDLITKDDITTTSDLGKSIWLWDPFVPEGKPFGYSSTLSNVGVEWDVSIPNKTKVMVLSDSINLTTTRYGKIDLTQVMAHTIAWVPTMKLIETDD